MATSDFPTVSLDSFIVRVYRIDPKDDRSLVGVVELVDGSGVRETFSDADQLGSILHRCTSNACRKERRAERVGRHHAR